MINLSICLFICLFIYLFVYLFTIYFMLTEIVTREIRHILSKLKLTKERVFGTHFRIILNKMKYQVLHH